MKKRIKFRKLNRTPSHKWAMLRNMVTSLIKHERIVTTVPKAKELKYLADWMVQLTKKEPKLANIRRANTVIREKPVLTKLFEVLGPRYKLRDGGYTRIMKLSKNRQGDNAPMAVMEYIDRPGELRAARPPTSIQQSIMAAYMKDKIGIDPSVGSLEEGLEKLDIIEASKLDAQDAVDGDEEKDSEGEERNAKEAGSKDGAAPAEVDNGEEQKAEKDAEDKDSK